jgi:ppGpp synthetase/RelA/SpoT-type nucleotidyltranferase
MHSYIAIHQFTPQAHFKPLETLTPLIEKIMNDQNASRVIAKDDLESFQKNIVKCIEIYYKLIGIDEKSDSTNPRGILPRYTQSLIRYFRDLEENTLLNNEIKILQYSGVTTIKIRYKYTESVIKKLVKLGLRDKSIFDDPMKIFFKGGALHDLIGILFICSSPYEKIWVARSMYNFFEHDYRTDDHLTYGFYTVKRKSGYSGLHCDHTLFNPRFDTAFTKESKTLPFNSQEIFSLVDDSSSDLEVLDKLKNYFNIEIQIHTAFENLWASMEHRNSYNVQAKGAGRNAEITAQWKFLSDNMKNLEMQFERLQIDTEQAAFKEPHREGYEFIKYIFKELNSDENNIYQRYLMISKNLENLETLFTSREISRQDYVEQIFKESKQIDTFILTLNDSTLQVLFKMLAGYMHYALANHREFFNSYDLHQFVKQSMQYHKDIHLFMLAHTEIYKGKIIHIIAMLRYLKLAQKYGYGLIDIKDVTYTYRTEPIIDYTEGLIVFENAITSMNRLSEDDLAGLRYDSAAYIKVIYRFEMMSQEWELFKNDADTVQGISLVKEIELFRKKFIHASLLTQLETLLETDKITNVSFVVRFYALLVWHNICQPIDALRQIIKYSAYDKIKTSDILYYELAAYKFLVVNCCEKINDCSLDADMKIDAENKIKYYKSYHRNNMIQQLFRIYRDEPIYNFHKARVHFEKLTQMTFKINHFSDTINNMEILKDKGSKNV